MPLEQRSALLDVAGVGNRPVDLEVISPAGELDAVEAPRSEVGCEVGEGQVGPLAGEESDGSGHLGSLRTGLMLGMLAQAATFGRGREPVGR